MFPSLEWGHSSCTGAAGFSESTQTSGLANPGPRVLLRSSWGWASLVRVGGGGTQGGPLGRDRAGLWRRVALPSGADTWACFLAAVLPATLCRYSPAQCTGSP